MNDMICLTSTDAQKICLERNIPFYCYRLPNDVQPIFGAGLSEGISRENGFVMHPFSSKDNLPSLFIPADIEFSGILKDKFLIDQLLSVEYSAKKTICQQTDITREEYLTHVNHLIGVMNIQKAGVDKIVYARTKTIKPLSHTDVVRLFTRLQETYSNAFVYHFFYPGVAHWVGATPEVFFRQNENGFETMALAGTKTINEDDTPWGEKEIREQSFVSEYVRAVLSDTLSGSFFQSETTTHRAGDISHLCTRFWGNQRLSDDEMTRLLPLLHPTPAVGGVPSKQAVHAIEEHEPVARRYYAGYLGSVNNSGSANLFVNLRCMECFSNATRLYAGGGLTKESQAEKEWAETELKMNTLLQFIE